MAENDFHYTDEDAVKSELELGGASDFPEALDPLLLRMIGQASRFIDGFKSLEPGAFKSADVSADETRYYFGSGLPKQFIDYLTDLTTVSVEETDGTYTPWTIDVDFYTLPYNAALIGEPIRRLDVTGKTGTTKSVWAYGPRRIEIVGKFGVSVNPPADIIRAALIQTQRWYQRALQGWNDTGASPELGTLTFTKELDPDVKNILKNTFPHKSRISV